jgi:hypothetical protein
MQPRRPTRTTVRFRDGSTPPLAIAAAATGARITVVPSPPVLPSSVAASALIPQRPIGASIAAPFRALVAPPSSLNTNSGVNASAFPMSQPLPSPAIRRQPISTRGHAVNALRAVDADLAAAAAADDHANESVSMPRSLSSSSFSNQVNPPLSPHSQEWETDRFGSPSAPTSTSTTESKIVSAVADTKRSSLTMTNMVDADEEAMSMSLPMKDDRVLGPDAPLVPTIPADTIRVCTHFYSSVCMYASYFFILLLCK